MLPGKRCRAGGVRKTVDERLRVHGGDPRRIQVTDPALEFGRSAEGLLDGDLLVQLEADEQGERLADEESVRVGIAGERERGGRRHPRMVVPDC